jgi:hypothetical protein
MNAWLLAVPEIVLEWSDDCLTTAVPRPSGRLEWVGTGRTAELCLPIPPVATVHAAFTAHGDRLVGLFSSSTSDMVPCVESIDYPGYPRFLEA